jgi:hypothetical protein
MPLLLLLLACTVRDNLLVWQTHALLFMMSAQVLHPRPCSALIFLRSLLRFPKPQNIEFTTVALTEGTPPVASLYHQCPSHPRTQAGVIIQVLLWFGGGCASRILAWPMPLNHFEPIFVTQSNMRLHRVVRCRIQS